MTQSLPPKSLVLYADDDADDISLLREAFQKFSQTVDLICFPNGLELLHFIDTKSHLITAPCLIILDINMPRLNGIEVLKKLRKTEGFREVPVVLFSTSTLPSEAATARSLQAGFVTKPLIAGQIYQIVDALLMHCSEEVQKRIRRR